MRRTIKMVRAFLIATIGLMTVTCQASAESWHAAEGPCLDWTGTWEVNQSGPGTWTGRINYRHTGGDCIGPHDTPFSANVNVQFGGEVWTAQRLHSSDGNDCQYGGTVQGTQLVGQYHCRNGGPYKIKIDRGH